ncbi:MAG: DUF6515 family protein [Bacteroidota bacterium]
MSAKNYTQKLILIMGIALLIVGTGADAQRGYGRSYRHYGHYGRDYYYGPRVHSFYHPYFSVGFGGLNYRYYGGYYYRPFGGYYRAVIPPFGIRITVLPPGYHRIYVGSYPYYYYNGIYYSPTERNDYKVVAPPLGAQVPDLPADAQPVIIDGQKYYTLNGTYYVEERDADNKLSYTVVGVNGELNTGNNANENNNQVDRVGDKVNQLPANSKAIIISGKKYFEAPSGLYYEEIISPNKRYYEVVGKADE